ncbi:interleukin-19-like protein [Corchorus olitorius]|uniref:Interleukin-19-like protein n=1 Tax=Corchorus olitorius TaxID=93759 RepID=A0A1R3HR63_9ROSI|nr:interleukin-19-like protein [Corchorus olitorius]
MNRPISPDFKYVGLLNILDFFIVRIFEEHMRLEPQIFK